MKKTEAVVSPVAGIKPLPPVAADCTQKASFGAQGCENLNMQELIFAYVPLGKMLFST